MPVGGVNSGYLPDLPFVHIFSHRNILHEHLSLVSLETTVIPKRNLKMVMQKLGAKQGVPIQEISVVLHSILLFFQIA